MAAPHVSGSQWRDDTLHDLHRAGEPHTVNEVLDRPRIVAEPSNVAGAGEVLSDAALEFLMELHERFNDRRLELLKAREERQVRFDAGELPDFPRETLEIRASDWTVGDIPSD